MKTKVHFSSNTIECETPQDLFEQLDKEFHFTLDPCSTNKNAKCKKYFTKKDDGLTKSWTQHSVFMNPPYGRQIEYWVEKAYKTSQVNPLPVVCLLPARTDTYWWHNYVMKADEIRFIRGRLKFSSAKNSAPFPSCIVVFRSPIDHSSPGSINQPICTSYKL